MDLFVLDFEAQFERHLKQWVQKNRSRFEDVDEMEEQVESVYHDWLEAPAAFLNGVSPNAYFDQFDDPRLLVRWMFKYLSAGVWVPDPMMDRIASLGEAAHAPLMDVLMRRVELPPGDKGTQAQILAIGLLSDAHCAQPLLYYIETMLSDPHNEFVEHMAQAMQEMGELVREPLLEHLREACDGEALEWALSVLSDLPGDERIFQELIRGYAREDTAKATLAGCLAKYGDERALPMLKEALCEWGLGYIDWIETRQAYEELGGLDEIPQPDFSGDPEYESLKALD